MRLTKNWTGSPFFVIDAALETSSSANPGGSAYEDAVVEHSDMTLKVYGPIGAVVCAIIWLIARPDRRSHDAERSEAASDP